MAARNSRRAGTSSTSFKIGATTSKQGQTARRSWKLEMAEEADEDDNQEANESITELPSDDDVNQKKRSLPAGDDGTKKKLRVESEDETSPERPTESPHRSAPSPMEIQKKKIKKKVRYAWMDSDDESVTASSNSDDEAPKGHPIKSYDSDMDRNDSEECQPPASKRSYLPTESVMNVAFVSNVAWEAALVNLRRWVEGEMGSDSIVQLVPAPDALSNEGAPQKGVHPGGKPESTADKNTAHKGKVFVEFNSFEVAQDAISRLNKQAFQGRPLRWSRAYKDDVGRMFILDSKTRSRVLEQSIAAPF
eukprot:GHVN01063614.1.p1 GENE.GHVN01063614.1~~GHVN01063614.1.p1  ORF type:complete len:306 (+),score=51.65 GHVN01063614.1:55-972(+)